MSAPEPIPGPSGSKKRQSDPDPVSFLNSPMQKRPKQRRDMNSNEKTIAINIYKHIERPIFSEMPNSRRRKFAVRNGIAGRGPSKPKNDLQTSTSPDIESEIKTLANNMAALKCTSECTNYVFSVANPESENKLINSNTLMMKRSKSGITIHPHSSKNTNNIVSITESSTSMAIVVNKRLKATVDKDVTASSSNIDLFNLMYTSENMVEPWKEPKQTIDNSKRTTTRPSIRERVPLRREKYQRQHRIKVRSPKRRIIIGISDTLNKTNDNDKLTFSVGTEAIDWEREHTAELFEDNAANVVETFEDEERQSDHSSDDMCRICHGGDRLSEELGQLISACSCRGTVGRVHVKCLERWLTESGKSRCELCGTRYITRRVHRYGVPRALLMWVLSQNAKQLMVDSLGIMLMSPLAVLAAWLTGRTLAGLMSQETHTTPWPLASTFVLACMTLVCYYCWIVSAATRHALGWWIWYRSQYEVRLQLLEEDE